MQVSQTFSSGGRIKGDRRIGKTVYYAWRYWGNTAEIIGG
jgi:hypothetical protein